MEMQGRLSLLQEKVLSMGKKDPERKKAKAEIRELEVALGRRVAGFKSVSASARETPGETSPR